MEKILNTVKYILITISFLLVIDFLFAFAWAWSGQFPPDIFVPGQFTRWYLGLILF